MVLPDLTCSWIVQCKSNTPWAKPCFMSVYNMGNAMHIQLMRKRSSVAQL